MLPRVGQESLPQGQAAGRNHTWRRQVRPVSAWTGNAIREQLQVLYGKTWSEVARSLDFSGRSQITSFMKFTPKKKIGQTKRVYALPGFILTPERILRCADPGPGPS